MTMHIKDIEGEFNKVVLQIGGDLVRNRLPSKSPDFENADYVFDKENVIAELKILQKDPSIESELDKKIQAKFDKWMDQGKLVIYGLARVESKNLPAKMQWELLRIYSEPVRRVIKKANRQIRDTKDRLKMSNAQGLVIIVNDGNYTLEPEHFGFAAHQSLTTDYSSIHVASLVTVNMEAKKAGIPTSLRLWMDYVRNSTDKIDPTFLLRLRTAWIQLYSSITGEPVPILNQAMVDLSSLKYENK